MIDNTALQACPFCGGEDMIHRKIAALERNYHVIECRSCFVRTGMKKTKKEAISAWNRRAEPANEPLTCEGCMEKGQYENEVEYGYPSPCTRCKRRSPDNYRRKPEPEGEEDV